MAPREFGTSWSDVPKPSYLNSAGIITIESYIKGLRRDDGAEGLWRINDNLYNLRDWVYNHPGGAQWLKLTRGTDITEAFETHHLGPMAEKLLPQFFVKKAAEPRKSPYTFHPDGFYKTLKSEVYKKLGPNIYKSHPFTKMYIDSLAVITLTLSTLTSVYNSMYLASVAGVALCLLTIVSHNYFHRKDNWRMYYFHLSFLSVREWRVSHALSHHVFTNTDKDLEMMMFYPVFDWMPHEKKKWYHIYLAPIYQVLTFPFIWNSQILKRLVVNTTTYADSLCLVIPLLMYICGGQSFNRVFWLWMVLNMVGSFVFGVIGLNAAHHHPEIFHQGDAPREDRDWGINQIDAVRAQPDERNKFVALATFGEHALHHLFPTIDHAYLGDLHDVLRTVCHQFGIKLEFKSRFALLVGQLRQLTRTKPNDKLKYAKVIRNNNDNNHHPRNPVISNGVK